MMEASASKARPGIAAWRSGNGRQRSECEGLLLIHGRMVSFILEWHLRHIVGSQA